MIPATRNIQIRGPVAIAQARKLPVPLSFKLVTSITFPPRPPTDREPNPSAPGNAGRYPTGCVGCGVGV